MRTGAECLLVHAGGRRLGLPLDAVVEVLEPGEFNSVPSVQPAMLGVTNQRGRLVPVFELDTLVGGPGRLAPGASEGRVLVLADIAGRRVGLMVDDAEVVVRSGAAVLQADDTLPWARAIIALPDDTYIPLLDLAALGARLAENGT